MLKKITILFLVTIGFVLTGCRDDAKLVKQIQTNFDDDNSNDKEAFCFYVGPRIDFPYTTKNTSIEGLDPRAKYKVNLYRDNEKLNARLALFSQQGLFTQQLITPADAAPYGKAIYRYDVTNEGKKYLRLSSNIVISS